MLKSNVTLNERLSIFMVHLDTCRSGVLTALTCCDMAPLMFLTFVAVFLGRPIVLKSNVTLNERLSIFMVPCRSGVLTVLTGCTMAPLMFLTFVAVFLGRPIVLKSNVTLNERLSIFMVHLDTCRSGVLTVLTGCDTAGAT